MHLTLTQYIDAAPHTIALTLERAVSRGLSAAADRLAVAPDKIVFGHDTDALRIDGGLDVLAGSEIRVLGDEHLTTVQVVVPWTTADNDGNKFRAANILAHTIGTEVRPAA